MIHPKPAEDTYMFDLKNYLRIQRDCLNGALSDYISRMCVSERMRQPVQYSLMAGGKRVRPILCMAACEAVNGNPGTALPAACALEMVHTYSLIHDDLPALDNDTLRRGQATCHVKFDEALAILTGDALLTMAFEVLAEAGLKGNTNQAHNWVQVIATISTAAGCRGMVEGQARDLAFEGKKLSAEQLHDLHALKTGALFRASVVSGGQIGGGTEEQVDHLSLYADRIGLAFQVVDDILNVTGDPKLLGKAVGTDQARMKNTYPALMGLEESKKYAHSLIDDALKALIIFDNKAEPLRAIARYIVERQR